MPNKPHSTDCMCDKCEARQIHDAISEREAKRPLDAATCSAGSMLRCYWAFIEYFPWKKSEFPTCDIWICSDADDARIFRQGWAARCRALENTLPLGAERMSEAQRSSPSAPGGNSLPNSELSQPDCE